MPDSAAPQPSTPPQSPAQAGWSNGLTKAQANWAMIAVFTALSISTLEAAIANIALPAIAADLHASEADVIWVVNIYQIAILATLLPFAALGEIIGHEHISRAGILAFTLGSLGCALAPSLPWLLLARTVQGVGASGIWSVNGALVQFIFPPNKRGVAFGRNALVVAISFSLAPSVAAAILAVSSWPWLFAINVPIGLVSYLIARKTLPKTPRAAHVFDIPGALLAGAGTGLIVIGISSAAHHNSIPLIAAELVAGVAFTWALIRRQKDHPAPMLPIDLFRIPVFSLSAATAVCSFAVQSLAFVSLPFLFEDVMHRSQVETGLYLTPWPVLVGVMSPIAGWLSDRYPVGALGSIGLATLGIGMAFTAMLGSDASLWSVIWRLALCGIGFGFFQAPNMKAVMTSAPVARSGSASGIVSVARLVGQSLGAASAALCFLISGAGGATLALWLGAGFGLLGCIMSATRLAVAPVRR
jgi:DHA2 family multidrug resistance protein-like MFS transporter